MKTRVVVGAIAGVAGLLALGVWGGRAVGWVQYTLSGQVPQEVQTCIPLLTDHAELWGTVQSGSSTYHLISLHRGAAKDEVLISVNDKGACQAVYPQNSTTLHYPSQFLPMNLARQLALQKYSREIQRQGSPDAFEKALRDKVRSAEFLTYLPPEEAWALEQLKVKIPRGVQVL